MNIYKELINEEIDRAKEKPRVEPRDVREKEPKEKKLGNPITDEWREKIERGLGSHGCKFLFSIESKIKNTIRGISRQDGREEVRYYETRLNYLTSLPNFKECGEERTQTEPKKKREPNNTKTPDRASKPATIDTTHQTDEPITTQSEPVAVETKYESPKVVPTPLYGSENEIPDIGSLQTDEFINDIIIDLDSQIINQKPEVQEKLKEYNLDAEKMSKLIPLTKETRDFMMKLDMEGLKLPHLMVLYDNIPEFYEAIRNNLAVDTNKLSPVTKVMNYTEFWDWTKKLWDKTSGYLINKVSGSIPELGEEFTVLP